MWNLRDKYAIVGIGQTEYSKFSNRTVLDLASEACLNASRDAGMSLNEIDGITSRSFKTSCKLARSQTFMTASSLGVTEIVDIFFVSANTRLYLISQLKIKIAFNLLIAVSR